jgi:hypothetical protein
MDDGAIRNEEQLLTDFNSQIKFGNQVQTQ